MAIQVDYKTKEERDAFYQGFMLGVNSCILHLKALGDAQGEQIRRQEEQNCDPVCVRTDRAYYDSAEALGELMPVNMVTIHEMKQRKDRS